MNITESPTEMSKAKKQMNRMVNASRSDPFDFVTYNLISTFTLAISKVRDNLSCSVLVRSGTAAS